MPATQASAPGDIVFIGDIHRQWHHVVRGLARLPRPPALAVLLGDMECHEPLDEVAAPLLDAGIGVHWIWGNHDYDGGPEMWANLTAPARNPRTRDGGLNARVIEIGGMRIAGLSGTFRRRVWEPPFERRLQGRAELAEDVATLGADWTDKQRDAMAHALAAMAIWPEDFDTLLALRADILVTHEAPSSHPQGFAMLDELARAMGAPLIIHGHHHVCYRARAEDGLEVQGVGAGWAVGLDGTALWQGEADRWLGAPPPGWQLT
jgi:predicted phosphodiesterase